MIPGKEYIFRVKEFYSFLITEFDFSIFNEKIRGNAFYDVQYGDKTKIISINYENIEDYFQVIIFILEKGKMPDYDDKTKTLHLNKLNAIIFPILNEIDIKLNNEYFAKYTTLNQLERKLLKSAKDLRLCLKHFILENFC